MYSNFLEAKKYFSHWKLKDLLQAITDVGVQAYGTPQWGTWETGFLYEIVTRYTTKLKEAFTLANIDSSVIDTQYISHSSDKRVSMVTAHNIAVEFGRGSSNIKFDFRNPLRAVTPEMTYHLVMELVDEVDERFGSNLVNVAKAYFGSEYNPIENYSMTQVETPNITHTKSGSSSETETPNITETVHNETNSKLVTDGTSEGNVFGFGGSSSSPMNEGESHQTTHGTKDDNFTDSERKENGTRTVSGTSGETETETGTRRLTRSGNIGVTTSQQMLQSELELRRYDFLEEVFKCFDKVLCASVY